MQVNSTEYMFTCHEVALPTKLIQAYHVVSGMPHTAYVFDDQAPIQWLIDNDIDYKNEKTDQYTRRILVIKSIENSMAFKLRWI